jgi:hypothetical protein
MNPALTTRSFRQEQDWQIALTPPPATGCQLPITLRSPARRHPDVALKDFKSKALQSAEAKIIGIIQARWNERCAQAAEDGQC